MSKIVALVARVDIPRAGILLFASIGIMAAVGVWAVALDTGNPWFDLDSEMRLRWPLYHTTIAAPAVWSALLLAGASVTWLAAASLVRSRLERLLMGGFGLFLLFMAGDEVVTLHEHFQHWLRTDWMALYAAPVALMGLLVLALLVRLWRIDRGAFVLLLVGCAAWGLAQYLELIQWEGEPQYGDTKVPMYAWMMVTEELGEATGSALFGLASISAVKALLRSGSAATAAGPTSPKPTRAGEAG